MQTDGNLVLYRFDGMVRWNSQTMTGYGNRAIMQYDGNFVVYSSANQPLWHTYTGGYPNAFLAVQNDGNLVVYSSSGAGLWNIGSDIDIVSEPRFAGDVLGRDLKGVGFLGHLGIWDGVRVIEMLNEGNANKIKYNTLANFKSRSPYWGVAAPYIPSYNVTKCFASSCTSSSQWETVASRTAITKRTYQALLIGADYTILGEYKAAFPGGIYAGPQRGLYRCDTFVIDMLDGSGGPSPYNTEMATWFGRLGELRNMAKAPDAVFNKLRTYK